MIRRRGENVSSAELETALLKHPLVVEAAVVGLPSEYGDEEIHGAIVARESSLTRPDLIAFLADKAPRFALPRFVRFVAALPRTQATQRVEKHALRSKGVAPETWDRERK